MLKELKKENHRVLIFSQVGSSRVILYLTILGEVKFLKKRKKSLSIECLMCGMIFPAHCRNEDTLEGFKKNIKEMLKNRAIIINCSFGNMREMSFST